MRISFPVCSVLIILSQFLAKGETGTAFPRPVPMVVGRYSMGENAEAVACLQGGHSSIVMLGQGARVELPPEIWVTQALQSADGKMLLLLLNQTGPNNSGGLWYYGLIVVKTTEEGLVMTFSMMRDHISEDGKRRSIIKVEDVSSYPVVQFEVATTASPTGGRVTRQSELWNVEDASKE